MVDGRFRWHVGILNDALKRGMVRNSLESKTVKIYIQRMVKNKLFGTQDPTCTNEKKSRTGVKRRLRNQNLT